MTDEITERILNESADSGDDESSNNTSITGPKGALSAFGVAIGIWTLLALAAGWEKQFPVLGFSPGIIIIITVCMVSFFLFVREARRLPFIPDLRDGMWELIITWCVMVIGAGILAAIILWGPPGLSEMLREVGT